ncbi:MAG: MATE family efflux transporter [Clostridia bacterium]|nr:MATE family efflux transporter [Clostridia bacterium]
MEIKISDHFNLSRLLRFVFPSIVMMMFTSIYGIVDGFFVSNFTGSTQFAAVNFIIPFAMICSAVGFMIGTGGTALVSMYLGQKNEKKANSVFSLLVYVAIILGFVITIVGELIIEPVAIVLGATKDMLPYCLEYGRILLVAIVPFMLQNMFQSFLVAAGKPKLGLITTVISGVSNMALDAILVGALRLGVSGAAIATGFSQLVGGVIPFVYLVLPNSSNLKIGKCEFDFKAIIKTFTNGISEFLTNIALSVVNMLYNFQLLRYIGENGVSAYGVLMYVCFVFISAFIGYSMGVAPIVGYNFGAKNKEELTNVLKKSAFVIFIGSIMMTMASLALAKPFSILYVGYDEALLELTTHAFYLYSFQFVFVGYNIFGSSFFTALNNGLVSGILSFVRTFALQIICVLLLPLIFDVDGIWIATTVSEFIGLTITFLFVFGNRKKYGYLK